MDAKSKWNYGAHSIDSHRANKTFKVVLTQLHESDKIFKCFRRTAGTKIRRILYYVSGKK